MAPPEITWPTRPCSLGGYCFASFGRCLRAGLSRVGPVDVPVAGCPTQPEGPPPSPAPPEPPCAPRPPPRPRPFIAHRLRPPAWPAPPAARAARLAERTAANVATASTSVPNPVTSEETVVHMALSA